jgi:photosystem II stability/assembly factor-like uncharacterized protein
VVSNPQEEGGIMNTPRRIRTLLALAVLPCVLVVSHPEVALADWTQTNGPKGGSIRSLLAVPNGAGGTSLHAGQTYVWRTDDQGASWTQHRSGLTDPTPFALLAVPNGSGGNDILAGTANGIFRSANNGASWNASGNGIPANLTTYALASGPNGSGGTNLYAGMYMGQVFRSTDNGASWTTINSGLPVGQANVNALVTTSSGTVLAGTMNGIYRSTNFGDSWTRVFTSYSFSFARHGTTLYAGTANGVWRSTNDGANWTAINAGMGFTWIYAVAAIPNGSGVTLFGSAGAVFRSTDNGATWTPVNNGLPSSFVYALTTAPNASGGTDLYAGTTRGIFRTSNNGDSWINASFVSSVVRGLAVTPGGAILAATENYIFRSSDAGASWTDTNVSLTAHDFTVSPNGSIFACSFADGVFKSTDGGVTWAGSNNNLTELEVNTVAAVPNGSGGTNILAGTYSGIFISSNDGGSWDLREVNSMPFDFAVIPDGSGGHEIFGGGEAGVWSSTNYGATWGVLGLGATARSVVATNNGASLFAGGEAFGVYRSTDGGANWTLVNNGLADLRIKTLLSPDGTNLFAAGVGGVFLSIDQGDHWTSVSTGLTAGVLSLAMSADGTNLLAGTTEFGVWTRPLSEMNIVTGVAVGSVPRTMTLRAYPNPFNPQATIEFSLPEANRVHLAIYDVSGRLVRTLVDGIRNAGDHRVIWDGLDDGGRGVSSGVYLYQLEAGDKSVTRKMSLLR